MIWGCNGSAMNDCPFCRLDADRILMERDGLRVIGDGYPVSPGHLLIIPARHIASFRDMTEAEWCAALALIKHCSQKARQEDPSIAGFNVGINDGPAAGQTVMHAHIHLIPRRTGDAENPRGGVRGVIPGKADY